MSLGYASQVNIVARGDTAVLAAFLEKDNRDIYSGESYTPEELISVLYTIQSPNGSQATYPGEIGENGEGILHFNETNEEGHYVAVASFTLSNGDTKSTKTNFEVQNPFHEPEVNPENAEEALYQAVWRKVEACFDSQDGGPWLREMTLRIFNPDQIANFTAEAVFDYNMFNPPTEFQLNNFISSNNFKTAPNPLFQVIVQGTYLAVIRHLMRSYVEQPNPIGGQITYEDRRDYQQRWEAIYNIEYKLYERWAYLSKRYLFGLGRTKSIIFSKSRSPFFYGAWRGGRGFTGYW